MLGIIELYKEGILPHLQKQRGQLTNAWLPYKETQIPKCTCTTCLPPTSLLSEDYELVNRDYHVGAYLHLRHLSEGLAPSCHAIIHTHRMRDPPLHSHVSSGHFLDSQVLFFRPLASEQRLGPTWPHS